MDAAFHKFIEKSFLFVTWGDAFQYLQILSTHTANMYTATIRQTSSFYIVSLYTVVPCFQIFGMCTKYSIYIGHISA